MENKDELKPVDFAELSQSERSFQSDFSTENGNYLNNCCICHQDFIGYKRRVVCKVCGGEDKDSILVVVSDELGLTEEQAKSKVIEEKHLSEHQAKHLKVLIVGHATHERLFQSMKERDLQIVQEKIEQNRIQKQNQEEFLIKSVDHYPTEVFIEKHHKGQWYDMFYNKRKGKHGKRRY